MRVSLTLIFGAFALGGCASSQPIVHQVTSRVHVYDDPRISVVSPAVRDDVTMGQWKVGADYSVDVVSGATQVLTVDAVSSATRFSERRHQIGASATYKTLSPETEISGSYMLSVERDDVVHAPSLGITRELFDRMARASIRHQLIVESIGRADDPEFSSQALQYRIDLGWTQILTKTVSFTGLFTTTIHTCETNIGCIANPYRYVGIDGVAGGVLALSERHPNGLITGAAAPRVAWAFSPTAALLAGYRFSVDTWDVQAHTADVALSTEWFDKQLLLQIETRATTQTAASFYQASYEIDGGSVPAFRTADAELSALRNFKLQLHLEWEFDLFRWVGEFGRIWNDYPDFPSLPQRPAWIGGFGLDANF